MFTTTMEMPTMDVRVELEELDAGRTRLTLTHIGMPNDDSCGIIRGGWTNSRTALDDIVAVRS